MLGMLRGDRLMKGKFGMQKIMLVYTALHLHIQFKYGVNPNFRN